MPCNSERTRRFGATYRLQFQVHLSSWSCWFLVWPALRPRRWRRYVPPKHPTSSELYGGTTLRTVLYIMTHVTTGNTASANNWVCPVSSDVSVRGDGAYRRNVLPQMHKKRIERVSHGYAFSDCHSNGLPRVWSCVNVKLYGTSRKSEVFCFTVSCLFCEYWNCELSCTTESIQFAMDYLCLFFMGDGFKYRPR
jgi:hypothetical protein